MATFHTEFVRMSLNGVRKQIGAPHVLSVIRGSDIHLRIQEDSKRRLTVLYAPSHDWNGRYN